MKQRSVFRLLFCILFVVFLSSPVHSRKSNITTCESFNDCNDCSKASHHYPGLVCFWCDHDSVCASISTLPLYNCSSWCSGGHGCQYVCEAPCSTEWAPCSNTWSGEIILIGIYGLILAYGAKMIGDGSELLLEILDSGIIGALVLPVLGAVPDAAVVIASGIGGSQAEAQTQLSVGVGTLAGSTIMLLTITWGASLFLARCDIRHGEALDRTLTSSLRDRHAWNESGVSLDNDTPNNARIALFSSLAYLIVQGVAFAYLSDPSGDAARDIEKWFALAGFIVCTIVLVLYCAYQLVNPKLQQKKMEMARAEYRKRLAIKTAIYMMQRSSALVSSSNVNGDVAGSSETTALISPPIEKPVDVASFGLRWKAKAQEKRINGDGEVFDDASSDDSTNSEVEGMTKGQIARKAALLLFVGTAIVAIFSDPMVDVIDAFGDTINIGAFYLSFVITPFCSNASELISSLMFAAKKRRKNTSLTYSQIYGAVTMNATLVLGVFCALIAFRDLAWTFSAETLAILFVTLCVGSIGAFLKTYRLYWAPIVLSLYPISLLMVWLLEKFADWT